MARPLPDHVAINLGISIEGPNTALISGTVANPAHTQGVEIFGQEISPGSPVNDSGGPGNDLGPATLNPDGTWTFDAFYDPQVNLNAVATDTFGNQETSNPLTIVAHYPMPGQTLSANFGVGDANGAYDVYNAHGRTLYTGLISTVDNTKTDDVTGTGGPGIHYSVLHAIDQYMENFRVGGPRHDTLDLANTDLKNLAQVIHHTTMNGGDATVHVDSDTSVTFVGVTKHELATHKQDFVFG